MPSRSYLYPKDADHLWQIADHILDLSEGAREEQALPIFQRSDLAMLVGVRPSLIHWMCAQKEKHYDEFPLKKKSGKKRWICAPKVWLKSVQWWILENILRAYEPPEYVFGFCQGRGPLDNAQYHSGAKHILNVDIKDFFPSVTEAQVTDCFLSLGYNYEVSELLADLTTYKGSLPQGAPTSPAISNLVLKGFDAKVRHYFQPKKILYSRYADDITLSAQFKIGRVDLYILISDLLESGFELNNAKTKFMGHGDRMEVTGYAVNCAPILPRPWRNTARGKLYSFLNGNPRQLDVHHVRGIATAVLNDRSENAQKLKKLARQVLAQKY